MALTSRPRAAAAGLFLDALTPEPPDAWHPVAWFGRAMSALERHLYGDSRAAGVAHVAVGAAVGAGSGLALRSTTLAVGLSSAGAALHHSARAVAGALDADDLERARLLVRSLVGRDAAGLDDKDLSRAVIESVAENTVDAVIAPAFWGALAGAPGALGHRAVNTLDSMVGHRNDRYTNFGWASARLDDALAWLPARLGAGLVALARPSAAPAVWRAVRTQAPAHPSPNAGVIEAAFAAALGLRIGGASSYGGRQQLRPTLGEGPAPVPADIERAVALSVDVTAALAGILAAWP